MTEELKIYLINKCRDWMLPEEIQALHRVMLMQKGKEERIDKSTVFAKRFGYDDAKVDALVKLGRPQLEVIIANRLLNEYNNEIKIINNCPKCGKLARTPRAKQCRYCGFDWH
jgi:hypothetical protein